MQTKIRTQLTTLNSDGQLTTLTDKLTTQTEQSTTTRGVGCPLWNTFVSVIVSAVGMCCSTKLYDVDLFVCQPVDGRVPSLVKDYDAAIKAKVCAVGYHNMVQRLVFTTVTKQGCRIVQTM